MDNTPESVDNLGNTPNTPNDPRTVTVPSLTLGRMTGQVAPEGPRPHLRPAQVQRLLGLGRTTVHDYEASGRLIASRTAGGHRRYPVDQPLLRDALAALEGTR